MSLRDKVVHSTWMYTNDTRPGHVSSLRFRKRETETDDFSPDDLEQIREDLESLADRLSSASWNAVVPTEKRFSD